MTSIEKYIKKSSEKPHCQTSNGCTKLLKALANDIAQQHLFNGRLGLSLAFRHTNKK
jgi:hypothetical protein